jgi:hypothetical protein
MYFNRDARDAMARGASAFTGDATLTGILFMDEDNTRYLKLTKTRYEPDFREIRFDSQLFPEIVIDQYGDPQTMLCRIAIPQPSTESDRKQLNANKQEDKRQQQVTDAADAACNFIQTLINTHAAVIMRKGPGRPNVPKELANAYKLEWAEVYQAVPQADQSYARKAVGSAIFQRFQVDPSLSGWVQLV